MRRTPGKNLLLVLLMLAFAGCGTLPKAVERDPSFAIADPESTSLGRMFGEQVDANEGESGFLPLIAGRNAYDARVALIGLAEKSLDIQYYLWADDLTGRAMLREVLAAAERGVRVRLLLDDIHTGKGISFGLLDRHPQIEVRVFNPFGWRDVRLLNWLVDGVRLNRRMHNKSVIADNALAVTGGRNIGDHYFAVDTSSNFRDLDLLAVGPAVMAMSVSFDDYWNSRWSYPIGDIEDVADEFDPDNVLATLDAWIDSQAYFPFMRKETPEDLQKRLLGFGEQLEWGRAHVLYDSPHKVVGYGDPGVAAFVFDSIYDVEDELLIEVSYLIPGDHGVALFGELVEKGAKVRVLTNSLATNDITAAHSGYMNYRKQLLRSGVQIHELRPDAIAEQRRHSILASESLAHLHTKAFVYDRERVFVGSLNVDPRSVSLNTEMGILVESRPLAQKVAALIEEGMHPENSYALALSEREQVQWRVSTGSREQWVDTEPDTGWWERFLARFFSWLPIEGHL